MANGITRSRPHSTRGETAANDVVILAQTLRHVDGRFLKETVSRNDPRCSRLFPPQSYGQPDPVPNLFPGQLHSHRFLPLTRAEVSSEQTTGLASTTAWIVAAAA